MAERDRLRTTNAELLANLKQTCINLAGYAPDDPAVSKAMAAIARANAKEQ